VTFVPSLSQAIKRQLLPAAVPLFSKSKSKSKSESNSGEWILDFDPDFDFDCVKQGRPNVAIASPPSPN
jgi:hypothetical protein